MGPAGAAPPIAADLFGDRLDVAVRYAELLASAGVERGLIGPREVDRLWERHLINCALVGDAFPEAARVVDVGSGAGLPGMVLAIRRPDLRIDLVESLQRRAAFLREAVDVLGLGDQVRVFEGRAEDGHIRAEAGDSGWVTARAVAPLDRLVRWCLPLLRPGGTLVAIKGAGAESEIEEHAAAVRRMGGSLPKTQVLGAGDWPEPTTVVLVVRETRPASKNVKGRA